MNVVARMLSCVVRTIEKLERVAAGFNMVMVWVMVIIVVYGVTMRYVFRAPVDWVLEITEYMLVALAFLAIAHVQYHRQHVTVDFLLMRLGKKTRTILEVVTTVCALVLFILITWASWKFALKGWGHKSWEAYFPLFPSRVVVTIGAFIMCLQLVIDLVHGINSLVSRPSQRQPMM